MKTNNTSAFRLALTALVCFILATTGLRAQTYVGDASVTTIKPSLKTAIWSVPNSSSVRMSFEKQGWGAVHIRIYDSQGKALYDQREYDRAVYGKYDLSELPAGVYTIDLQHADDHVSQAISLNTPQSEPMHIALLKGSSIDNRFITIK